MNSEQKQIDPSALGLFGLAVVTLVASSQKLGITSGVAGIIPWAIFLGGLAQLLAGILDYKKRNIFGATAFCAYGFFWLAMATNWFISLGKYGFDVQVDLNQKQIGFAFIAYLVLTVFLTIGALETNKVLFTIFSLIDILFLGLVISTFVSSGIVHDVFKFAAGLAEICIGIVSLYGAGANVLNNHFGFEFCPVGKPFGKIVKKDETDKNQKIKKQ